MMQAELLAAWRWEVEARQGMEAMYQPAAANQNMPCIRSNSRIIHAPPGWSCAELTSGFTHTYKA